ncbi:MAG TPA: hypothetical protein DD490_16300 [Acidobacteria bacterium]|nr:hypothetical protein [Acidobacteriota bacterium]
MDSRRADSAEAPSELQLADWRVQPPLNRLVRGATTVRIEPKLMDVLVFLARHAGQVVSKDDIAGAVWPEAFISESVISRAIAGLRRALDDDAREPRFIETIAKRGYRLLTAPTAAAVSSPMGPAAPAAVSPFSAGQWVRGSRFFGRSAEIAEILEGPRNGVWLLGPRAVGKTSLLKHLELLTGEDPASRFIPLFWDLQGSTEPDELHADFLAAVADAGERLTAAGIRWEETGGDDLFEALGRLRRAVRAQGRSLLLLWDEVEELLPLQARSPTLLRKLRRSLQSQEGIRTVMASGPRLWALGDRRDDTSPFLHGFAPPLALGPLEDGAARALLLQGIADPAMVEELLLRSGRQPSLLQMLGTRLRELGDLERATEAVATDPTLRSFLEGGLEITHPALRRWLPGGQGG